MLKRLLLYIFLIAITFLVYIYIDWKNGPEAKCKIMSYPQYLFIKPSLFTSETTTVILTSYSELETCPNRPCITASGGLVRRFHSLACPRYLELGTRVYIGDNLYVCDDRTATSTEGRFDIWQGYGEEGWERAIAFGKVQKVIEIVK